MTSITIPLSDDLLIKLKNLAKHYNTSPEELARASVEELVERPDESFQETMEYVLKKNKALYKRLAS